MCKWIVVDEVGNEDKRLEETLVEAESASTAISKCYAEWRMVLNVSICNLGIAGG